MARFGGERGKKVLVLVLAAAGIFVGIAAVALQNGYLPSTFFLGITAAEMGLLSAVLIAGSVFLYLA